MSSAADQRAAFAEVAAGVDAGDLSVDALDYHRARDKHDKSLEVYKFYVNALYVALTRAIRNVYLVEADTVHGLLRLLGLGVGSDEVRAGTRASSREDWQREARRLELQGKQEQAEAVRATILKETPVPWPVVDEPRVRDLLVKVFRQNALGNKPRQQLYEFATGYDAAGNVPLVEELLHRGADTEHGFMPMFVGVQTTPHPCLKVGLRMLDEP